MSTAPALQANAPRMLVVIVNYRTGPLVVDCLDSLEAERAAMPSLRVAVVDNASGDGSVALIGAAIEARGWSDWVRLMPSDVNGGFAAGNNIAVAAALADEAPPDLIWLLNPDTRVNPGAALALARFMDDTPGAGIAGSALIEGSGAPWPYAFRFPSILSEFERGARLPAVSKLLSRRAVLRRMSDRRARVDWVSGASMVVRRAVFDAIGLMDEGYFLYYEETDFCGRAARAGWTCWYVPEASITHIAGQSTGLTRPDRRPDRIPAYWFESRRRYFAKTHGRLYAALADLAWVLGHVQWRVRRRVQAKNDPDPPRLLADFLRNSAWFRKTAVDAA